MDAKIYMIDIHSDNLFYNSAATPGKEFIIIDAALRYPLNLVEGLDVAESDFSKFIGKTPLPEMNYWFAQKLRKVPSCKVPSCINYTKFIDYMFNTRLKDYPRKKVPWDWRPESL